MISASKYQHIIYFMSLLKVSLCILIGLNKGYCMCMDTHGGCRSKHSPPLGRAKTFFFAVWGAFLLLFLHGEGFMLRFSSHEGLFSSYRGLFATFSLRGGRFYYVFPLVWGLFHNVGAFLAIFFSIWGDFLVFMGDFMSLWVVFMGLPLPPMTFLRAHAIM